MNQASPIDLPGGSHAALLVHGLAGSPLEIRFVGRLLHRAGFSVHIPVIPGYSMATASADWEEWVATLEQTYLSLCRRYRTVCVGGLSSGATLALALAARQEKLRSLAL